MKKLLTLQEIYDEVHHKSARHIKVNVEIHDNDFTDYYIDITVTDIAYELDLLYASAEIDKDDYKDTKRAADKLADKLFKSLSNKYTRVSLNNWA